MEELLMNVYLIVARAQTHLTGLPVDDVMQDHISRVRDGLQEARDMLQAHV